VELLLPLEINLGAQLEDIRVLVTGVWTTLLTFHFCELMPPLEY
jgi:hypothetical protein